MFYVNVMDVNDNRFKFSSFVYNVIIDEDLVLGFIVMKFLVIDVDIGVNGKVIYKLSFY